MITLKSMKVKFVLSLIILTILFFNACEKPEGVGGKGIISGTVTVNLYDKEFKVLQDSFPAEDEDVFIFYGDQDVVSDEKNTSPDGKFEFKNLSKGKYNLFVYSEDKSGKSLNDVSFDTIIELKSHDDEVQDIKFTIYKTLDYDDGRATIKGNIYQVNWQKGFFSVIDTTSAQELDVYLVYENGETFIERTRTLQDGSYAFKGLLKGNYQIITYSDDLFGGIEDVARIETVSVTKTDQVVGAKNIYINKED